MLQMSSSAHVGTSVQSCICTLAAIDELLPVQAADRSGHWSGAPPPGLRTLKSSTLQHGASQDMAAASTHQVLHTHLELAFSRYCMHTVSTIWLALHTYV